MSIKDFFDSEKIEFFSIIPFKDVEIYNERKLESEVDFQVNSVIVFLIPYKSNVAKHNVSLYAVARDYHLYFAELYARFSLFAKSNFPNLSFAGFCDNSPINEKKAAAISGLGVRGKNSLIINEKYGSYVFIGEILTDMNGDFSPITKEKNCLGCSKCLSACPSNLNFSKCVSNITQKKNINEDEKCVIASAELIWGCDTCQEVCPLNEDCCETPIPFFHSELIPMIDENKINSLVLKGRFQSRAFAWRGSSTIIRNISLKNNKLK